MDTSRLLDVVYESEKDYVDSNFSLNDYGWGEVREELRQIEWRREDNPISWEIEAKQLNPFHVSYSARFEEYLIEGVIEGRLEDMDYF